MLGGDPDEAKRGGRGLTNAACAAGSPQVLTRQASCGRGDIAAVLDAYARATENATDEIDGSVAWGKVGASSMPDSNTPPGRVTSWREGISSAQKQEAMGKIIAGSAP